MEKEKKFIDRDFVYCGLYFASSALNIIICPIAEDGQLMPRQLYDYKRGRDMVVGGIYKGASFYDGGIKGLDNAVFDGHYPDNEAVIGWKATNDIAKKEDRLYKLEKDAKKKNEIDVILKPLRTLYATYRKRNDFAGVEALEAAVLRSLRTPVRKVEADDE